MENVPGIVSARGGAYIREVEKLFVKDYRIETKVINAADYGVPQIRKRFIMYGTKTDLIFPWPKAKFFKNPEPWQHSYRTVGEAITDLMDESTYSKYKNHVPPRHSKIVAKRFAFIKEGQKLNVKSLPEHLKIGTKTGKPLSNYSHIFKRLDRQKPSSTIVPGHNALPVHPVLNRTLTIREAARIQTFPDDYEFVGPIINQGLQVGNAFPCLVAQIFGERLRTVVNNGWKANKATNLAMYSILQR
jgi:DNA (cytosine-5)-methyltransferase 1